MYVLWTLMRDGSLGFGVLRRRLDWVSSKLLTQRLRLLEGEGLSYRQHNPTIPTEATYGLTQTRMNLATRWTRLKWSRAAGTVAAKPPNTQILLSGIPRGLRRNRTDLTGVREVCPACATFLSACRLNRQAALTSCCRIGGLRSPDRHFFIQLYEPVARHDGMAERLRSTARLEARTKFRQRSLFPRPTGSLFAEIGTFYTPI